MLVQDHYIGIDVGTGSARACLIDSSGDIKALASEAIKLWQPQTGYYVNIPGFVQLGVEGILALMSCTRNNLRQIFGTAYAIVCSALSSNPALTPP
jgi:ribulose kinase